MIPLLSPEKLVEMASRWLPPHQVPRSMRVHTDTTDFFLMEYDDVAVLNGKPCLIRHNAKELRFGLEDEPKFWDNIVRILDVINGESLSAYVKGLEIEHEDYFPTPAEKESWLGSFQKGAIPFRRHFKQDRKPCRQLHGLGGFLNPRLLSPEIKHLFRRD